MKQDNWRYRWSEAGCMKMMNQYDQAWSALSQNDLVPPVGTVTNGDRYKMIEPHYSRHRIPTISSTHDMVSMMHLIRPDNPLSYICKFRDVSRRTLKCCLCHALWSCGAIPDYGWLHLYISKPRVYTTAVCTVLQNHVGSWKPKLWPEWNLCNFHCMRCTEYTRNI